MLIAVYPSFKTGTTTIISPLLENVPRNQFYLNEEFINPECLVMSTSRVAVGGMTSGTMITYWIIQLTYKISSNLQIRKRRQNFKAILIFSLSVENIILYFLLRSDIVKISLWTSKGTYTP